MSSDFDQSWKQFPVIYLIGGMFFNYYQFASFVYKAFRRENIFIFFVVLVVADALVLTTPLINEWLKATVNLDLRTLSRVGCRFHVWMSGAAMDVPPWVLVVMAYEKRALFWFPVPADSQFSRTTAKQVMAALVALSLARHQHVMWGPLYNTIIITRVNESADATTRSADDEICNKTVCDVTSGTFGFFMTMHSPWIDLLVRVLAPCACLVAYNVMIVRKISREKYCAERLMEKVGIQPPSWFYTGVIELEATVRWTGSLTFLICINSLPLSFFYLLQPQCFGKKFPCNPVLRLVGSLLFYLNYSLIFPAFAVQDNHLLLIMRNTWQMSLLRKRGTHTASRAPDIMPEQSSFKPVYDFGQKAFSGTTAGGISNTNADDGKEALATGHDSALSTLMDKFRRKDSTVVRGL